MIFTLSLILIKSKIFWIGIKGNFLTPDIINKFAPQITLKMQDDLQAMQKALTMQAQGTKSKTPIKTPPYNKQRRKNSMPSNSVG